MRKILIFAILFLFACKKEESHRGNVGGALASLDTSVQRVASPAPIAPSSAPTEVPAARAMPQTTPRMIVRTADVRIVVADTSKAVEAVTKSAEAVGGYVSGSHIWRDGELLRAKLTLRVPAEKLTSTLAAIRGAAKRVENETVTSDDVSEEFVDLQSQVRNLEATETELRELLKTARVNSRRATDVLEVHEQLTIIRGQIEQVRGRMRYLSQVAAMSGISLEIVPDAIAQPVVEPGWQPVVVMKDASRALIVLMQKAANAAIWVVIYFLPTYGILAVGAALLWRFVRRTRAKAA